MHWTEATVLRNTELAPGYFLLDIEAPAMAREFTAGQFVMFHREEGDFPFLPRPFSACDLVAPSGSPRPAGARGNAARDDLTGVRFLVQVMGPGTASLGRLAPGDRVETWGPLGRAFTLEGAFDHAILVAGGIGLAPFPILVGDLRRQSRPPAQITLLYGARSASDLVYLDELRALDVDLRFATDDGSEGLHGTVLDLLRAYLAESRRDRVRLYGCGPEPMLEALAELAVAEGLPCELSMERMMACGVGACLACVVPVKADYPGGYLYEKTCIEGPVVDAHRLWLGASGCS